MKPREMRPFALALLMASTAEAVVAPPGDEGNIAPLKWRFHMVEGGKKS